VWGKRREEIRGSLVFSKRTTFLQFAVRYFRKVYYEMLFMDFLNLIYKAFSNVFLKGGFTKAMHYTYQRAIKCLIKRLV
jgi:hypothetical protein